jgi:hypothetical protein
MGIPMSRLVATCTECANVLRIHAKGLCKRCYLRAFNRTPERKARRREYIAQNREQVLASYRKYNEKRYPTASSMDELVRVPVKGWGFRL